jgi:hypothetical protein
MVALAVFEFHIEYPVLTCPLSIKQFSHSLKTTKHMDIHHLLHIFDEMLSQPALHVGLIRRRFAKLFFKRKKEKKSYPRLCSVM